MNTTSEPLVIDASGERELNKCPDCGHQTRQVWGFIEEGIDERAAAYAVYYIRWTDSRADHGTLIGLSIGGWGGSKRHKVLIGLQGVISNRKANYRFIDANQVPWSNTEQLGEPLMAHEVLNGPLATESLRILAALEQHDPRYRLFLDSSAT